MLVYSPFFNSAMTVLSIFARAESISCDNNIAQHSYSSGKIVALLFFQQSTRTRFSFESATLRLGARAMGFDTPIGTRSGGEWKETLADMARVMSSYADCVILRHPTVHGLQEYVEASSIPVISAGSGTGAGSEHPTQALLDLFTIRQTFGRLENIEILLVGGMQIRTATSFIKLLRLYPGCKLTIYPCRGGEISETDQAEYADLDVKYEIVSDLDAALSRADVIYHHGLAEDPDAALDTSVILTPTRLSVARKGAIILHSLPRVGELPAAVDGMPQARYFQQAANGVPIRMALLDLMFSGSVHDG
jgi:aspartate carbamoyltransferase catalytic subunit